MMNKKLFLNKNFTSDGKPRAYVELKNIETLWFNTGTLCNLQCNDCYIESSPCLLYTSPSPRDYAAARMPSSA